MVRGIEQFGNGMDDFGETRLHLGLRGGEVPGTCFMTGRLQTFNMAERKFCNCFTRIVSGDLHMHCIVEALCTNNYPPPKTGLVP